MNIISEKRLEAMIPKPWDRLFWRVWNLNRLKDDRLMVNQQAKIWKHPEGSS
jgi:hypothetical protein